MKLLSIGNSFSQDAHKWLHKLALAQNFDLETTNLYIGGCSLQTHWENADGDYAYYDLERNGGEAEGKISIKAALDMDQWDVITLQQVSQFSGMQQTYEPYFENLLNLVRSRQPQAQIWFHQTWAYEKDSVHPGFANYACDQQMMYQCILHTTGAVAQKYGLPMIPAAQTIQKIRWEIPEFDESKGGRSLCRDGFHMSYDYGRYAVAATWLAELTGKPVRVYPMEAFDIELLEKIVNVVNGFCIKN